MISKLITIRDMLRIMETGQAFSIRGNTFNRRDKSGGELYHYPECILLSESTPTTHTPTTTPTDMQRPLTPAEQGVPVGPVQNGRSSRSPQHRRWYTRNVRICQAGQPTSIIHKIHPPLITHFNGQTVVP